MSQRIAPSQKLRQGLHEMLSQGYAEADLPASQFLKLAAQMVVQQVLEQEVSDYLGRERYERQPEASGYRNGYKSGRIRSAEGEIRVHKTRNILDKVPKTVQPDIKRVVNTIWSAPTRGVADKLVQGVIERAFREERRLPDCAHPGRPTRRTYLRPHRRQRRLAHQDRTALPRKAGGIPGQGTARTHGERKTNPYKTEGLSPRFWQKKHLCLF